MPLDVDNALIGDWNADDGNTANNPVPGDSRRQGDDNIRRAKATVRRHFPNFVGTAAAPKTVQATEDQLNSLDTYVPGNGKVEARLAALEAGDAKFPGGGVTYIAFWQASAPTGWTQETDTQTPGLDNSMLRVVQTAGGGLGGTHSPIQMTPSQVPNHTHDWSTTGGSHTHPLNNAAGLYKGGSTQFAAGSNQNMDSVTVTAEATTHSHSGTTSENSGIANWEPKYVDMIIASKD